MSILYKSIDFVIRYFEMLRWRRFLKYGNYSFSKNLKCFCTCDDVLLNYVKHSLCIKKPFYFTNKKLGSKRGKFSILLFSNTIMKSRRPASVKFFDFNSNTIRTYYNSNNKIEIDRNSRLSHILPRPKIFKVDLRKHYIEEELIRNKPLDFWNRRDRKHILTSVMKNCISYYSLFIERNEQIVDSSDFPSDLQKYYDELPDYVKDLYNIQTLQHGDLSFSNILLSDADDIMYIDFEHEGYYFFLYDIFWIIQNDVVYNKENELLENYMNGEFDVFFKQLFKLIGYEYDNANRKHYFILFLVEMYRRRVQNLSMINKEIALRSILKLLAML